MWPVNNATFKLEDVAKLLHAGIYLVSEGKLEAELRSCGKIENESWDRDGEMDDNIQNLIIALGSDLSASSGGSGSETSAWEEIP